jgi:hypothetical protein
MSRPRHFDGRHFVKDMSLVLDATRESRFPATLAHAASLAFLSTTARGLGALHDSAVTTHYDMAAEGPARVTCCSEGGGERVEAQDGCGRMFDRALYGFFALGMSRPFTASKAEIEKFLVRRSIGCRRELRNDRGTTFNQG